MKADAFLKRWFESNERFADIFNTYVFGGREVVLPDTLAAANASYSEIIETHRGSAVKQGEFDGIRIAKDSPALGARFVVLVTEYLSYIEYMMPLRQMVSDAMIYHAQYQQALRAERENTKGPVLTASKGTEINAVVSLVLYFGKEPWDAPTSLHEILDLSPELRDIVNDYKIRVIDVARDPAVLADPENGVLFRRIQTRWEQDGTSFRKLNETLQILRNQSKELVETFDAVTGLHTTG